MESKAGLVTGAAGGIGRATAVALGREGAAVVVNDLAARRADGEETVAQVQAAGGRATFVAGDVSDSGDHLALVAAVVDDFGRLDFAVNNAGVEVSATLIDTTEDEWDAIMAVNLKGVWLGLKAQLPQMAAQGGGGAIVNVASLAGLIAAPALGQGQPVTIRIGHGTKTAAVEHAQHEIRVNAVCPAAIASDMILSMEPERQQELASPQALKRFGTPAEVAEAIVWLLSDRASFVTGTAMPVDAGSTAGIVLPGEVRFV